MLTTARSGAKTARNVERRAADGELRRWLLCAQGAEARGKEMGKGRAARAQALSTLVRGAGHRVEIVGERGACGSAESGEREEVGAVEGDEADRRARPVTG